LGTDTLDFSAEFFHRSSFFVVFFSCNHGFCSARLLLMVAAHGCC
jgi:hypothetical protein